MDKLFAQPIFGVATTVIAYVVGRLVHHRVRRLHALVTTCGLLIAMLLVFRIDPKSYQVGGNIVSFFLGPATVALAVPLYRHADRIRQRLAPVLLAIFAGAVMGIVSVIALAWLTRASDIMLRSLLPKSATTPISVELAAYIGGNPSIAAVATVLAGLIGSIVGPRLLRLLGVRDDISLGVAIGTSSHGIGTARLVHESDTQAGVSALAMAMCGIMTALLFVPLKVWMNAASP